MIRVLRPRTTQCPAGTDKLIQLCDNDSVPINILTELGAIDPNGNLTGTGLSNSGYNNMTTPTFVDDTFTANLSSLGQYDFTYTLPSCSATLTVQVITNDTGDDTVTTICDNTQENQILSTGGSIGGTWETGLCDNTSPNTVNMSNAPNINMAGKPVGTYCFHYEINHPDCGQDCNRQELNWIGDHSVGTGEPIFIECTETAFNIRDAIYLWGDAPKQNGDNGLPTDGNKIGSWVLQVQILVGSASLPAGVYPIDSIPTINAENDPFGASLSGLLTGDYLFNDSMGSICNFTTPFLIDIQAQGEIQTTSFGVQTLCASTPITVNFDDLVIFSECCGLGGALDYSPVSFTGNVNINSLGGNLFEVSYNGGNSTLPWQVQMTVSCPNNPAINQVIAFGGDIDTTC